MEKIQISVIIPTFNRIDKLLTCLSYLSKQNISKNIFEIIIVDDGSTDETLKKLKILRYKNLKLFSQKNAGQGKARNLGIKKAKGKIIIFIGDDIYPSKNFLKEHLDFHAKYSQKNLACLGFTDWYPKIKNNLFMKWLVSGGPQFAYYKLKHNKEASFWFFYTSNISIKKSLLKKNIFDPDFTSYGWEDIELAYRLKQDENLKIIFNKKALAYHDHIIEESSLENRMTSVGKSLNIFQKKHIELKLLPRGIKRIILALISSNFVLRILKSLPGNFFKRLFWYSLSKKYFLKGISEWE